MKKYNDRFLYNTYIKKVAAVWDKCAARMKRHILFARQLIVRFTKMEKQTLNDLE